MQMGRDFLSNMPKYAVNRVEVGGKQTGVIGFILAILLVDPELSRRKASCTVYFGTSEGIGGRARTALDSWCPRTPSF
jgi:hypothetical protein